MQLLTVTTVCFIADKGLNDMPYNTDGGTCMSAKWPFHNNGNDWKFRLTVDYCLRCFYLFYCNISSCQMVLAVVISTSQSKRATTTP